MNENQSNTYSNFLGILAGFLIGSMAGAVTMLLLPQSGKDTRKQIGQKGIELRDDATEMVDDAVNQIRTSANKVVSGGRKKFTDIKEFAANQVDRVADIAHGVKESNGGS